jgi:hypothetical protein
MGRYLQIIGYHIIYINEQKNVSKPVGVQCASSSFETFSSENPSDFQALALIAVV